VNIDGPVDIGPPRPTGWGDLSDRLRRRAAEAIDLVSILAQDSVILFAGFLAEYASDRWFHSSHGFFQLATNLSSAVFLLLYGVTVSVHVVHYVRGQMGAGDAGVLGKYLPWGIAGAAVIAAAVFATIPRLNGAPETEGAGPATNQVVTRFSIDPPEGAVFDDDVPAAPLPAISPDGRTIAFVTWTGTNTGTGKLWLRALDSDAARAVADTSWGEPFWSPDSQSIAFVYRSKLMRFTVATNTLQEICDLTGQGDLAGGAWNRDGTILVGLLGKTLEKVPASGGALTPVGAPRQQVYQGYPVFLPDQRHFLVLERTGRDWATGAIVVGSLDGDLPHPVVPGASSAPAFSPAGYLLFVKDRALMAQPFDAARVQTTGAPLTVSPNVDAAANNGGITPVTVSATGTLIYRATAKPRSKLVWFDRTGRASETVTEPGLYGNVTISPDGTQAAYDTNVAGRGDIWVYDFVRKLATRLTFTDANTGGPVWMPDGQSIVFRTIGNSIARVRLAAAGEMETLAHLDSNIFVDGTTPDGQELIYIETGVNSARHAFALPLAGDRKPVQLTSGAFTDGFPRLSPDGHWLAYVSNQTGMNQIYIQSFPSPRERLQVSVSGGATPLWSANGRELYYLTPEGTLTAAAVTTTPMLHASAPVPLFKPPLYGAVGNAQRFAVSRDGRFLMDVVADAASAPLSVVLNWPATLASTGSK
jgi:Tol biopolymer transport system component